MPIIAKSTGGGDFENPLAGSYIARAFKMVDVGTQDTTFMGKPSAPKRQLFMWFELLEDEDGKEYRMSDGQPFSVMQRYTLSMHKQALLRKHLEAWRGVPFSAEEVEAFDVEKVLGKYCRVQIVLEKGNDDKTYVNIASVGKTTKKPKGVNDTLSWSLEEPSMNVFESFPEWLQTKINSSAEWDASKVDKVVSGDINEKGDVVIEDVDDDPIDLDDVDF